MILTNNKDNIGRPDEYKQVCVWPGMRVDETDVHDFQEHFLENGYKVLYLETVSTGPDRDEHGVADPETGGRIDTIFAIHNDDVMRFAMPRLQMGIRWIEDVLDNEAARADISIYPDRLTEYRTW